MEKYRMKVNLIKCVLIYLVLYYIISFAFVIYPNRNSDKTMVDFCAAFTAVKIIAAGEGHNLYDFNTQAHFQQPLFSNRIDSNNLMPYVNPPFYALLLWPLSFFTFKYAYLTMILINVATLCLIVYLYQTKFSSLKNVGFFLMIIGCLSFFPCFINIVQGQNAIFALAIISIAYYLFKNGNDATAGALLALGLFKPQLIMIIVLLFLLKKRWRAIASFCCMTAILVFLSFIIVGSKGFIDYVNLTLLNSPLVDGQYTIYYAAMHNWRGLFRVLLGDGNHDLRNYLTLSLSGITIIALIWICIKRRESEKSHIELCFAFAVLSTLLVSPHLNVHDMTLLILVGAIILNLSLETKKSIWDIQAVIGWMIGGIIVCLMARTFRSILHIQITTVYVAAVAATIMIKSRHISSDINDSENIYVDNMTS